MARRQPGEPPVPGHKSVGMRTCHRVYCECGWSTEAHWERSQAWGEFREHTAWHRNATQEEGKRS